MVFAGKLVYNSGKGGMLMQSIALTAAARAVLSRYGLDARTLTGCRVQQYQPGETVLRQGDDAAYFHIVLDGAAKVCVNARNGRHLILCYYASSGVLGDVELMLPSPKTTSTVIAVSSSPTQPASASSDACPAPCCFSTAQSNAHTIANAANFQISIKIETDP